MFNMKKSFFYFIIIFSTINILHSQSIIDGLVAHWPFNANANDESGNGYDGLVYGATLTTDRNGNINSAYQFDGLNSYIDIPNISGNNLQTVSIWLKPNDFGTGYGNNFINLKNTLSAEAIYLSASGHAGYKQGIYSSVHELIGPTLSLGLWSHLVIVRNYLNVKFYLNGILQNDKNFNSGAPTQILLSIGEGTSDRGNFNGAIDDVIIYNRALTEEEVQIIYNDSNPPISGNSTQCENIFCDGENIGIGTNDTKGYKLAVAGNIISEEVKVALQTNWPDFVFEDNYKLKSLTDIEKYIKTQKHLPNIPSAKEIEKNGYMLGEMDSKLLEKIEELTLHLIKMSKRLTKLEKENQILRKINNN